MLVKECIKILPDSITDTATGDSIGGLIPFDDFNDQNILDIENQDLTEIAKLYKNLGAFKTFGSIFYDKEGLGILAENDIMSLASKAGLNMHIVSLNGAQIIRITDDILAFMEDDDDDDPDTGFFYFVGKIK